MQIRVCAKGCTSSITTSIGKERELKQRYSYSTCIKYSYSIKYSYTVSYQNRELVD